MDIYFVSLVCATDAANLNFVGRLLSAIVVDKWLSIFAYIGRTKGIVGSLAHDIRRVICVKIFG